MVDTFKRSAVVLVMGLVFSILISANLWAQPFTLSYLVDTGTPFPGGMSNFDDFLFPVSLDDGNNIGFVGSASPTEEGIYIFMNGELYVIADTSTAVPGSMGNFTGFSTPISYGGIDMGFEAEGSGLEGIYTYISGTLSMVADTDTAIPGGTGNFTNLGTPERLTGSDVAFLGLGPSTQWGIYKLTNGTLSVVADRNTPIPGGTGNFSIFGSPPRSLGGGDFTFFGTGSSSQQGIYSSISGTLNVIVDKNTPAPGTMTNFVSIGAYAVLNSGEVVFRTFGSGPTGIYKDSSGTLSTLVDTNVAIPGGPTNFTGFGTPVPLESSDIAFIGFNSSGFRGIYRIIGGTLDVAADTNTPIPGGSGNFVNFSAPISLGGGDVAFNAVGSSAQNGIYALKDGTLFLVVDKNTPIPGGTGNFTNISNPAFVAGGNIAFRGQGTSDKGIYIALMNGGTITIVKETNPDGETGFEFTGTGFPEFCSLGGTFNLDDDGFNDCTLSTGSYTVQETNSQGLVISDIACVGASDFSETSDSVTVNLMDSENVVCTFTNTEQYDLNINIAGDGVGNVSASGINCGNGGLDCMETYISGTEVTLTATPDAVSSFVSFTGDPDCSDGVVTMDAGKSCTATFDFIPLILNQIFPGIANNINQISAEQTTPGGNVAFVWGFQPSSVIIGGPTCNGLQIDIKKPKILSIVAAGADQSADYNFFVPNFGDSEIPILTQAVDIPTCRKSEVEVNVIRKD